MNSMLLLPAIAIAALAAIIADVGVRRPIFYLLKPLTTVLVILLAAFGAEAVRADGYRVAVVVALLCCLAGDTALMGHSRRALGTGVAAFMCGHALFITAFLGLAGIDGRFLGLVIVLLALPVLLLAVRDRLRPALGLYALVLVVMLACAVIAATQLGDGAAFTAVAGAALFLISDGLIARRMARGNVPGLQAMILSTYWAGISLLALSV